MLLSKDSTNKEIAEAFRQVASVYEVEGRDLFRIRAYQNAANSIELLSSPLKELWEGGRLEEVPGLGTKFIKYLDQLFRTGEVGHFNKILHELPQGFYPLLEVPGVGPKTAQKLTEQLHLNKEETAVREVETALKTGKLKGFSEKVTQRLLSLIAREHVDDQRMLINEAEYIAADVISYLKKSPDVIEAEALGSLRRKAATIGDIDIAVSTHHPKIVMEYLAKFSHIQKIVSTGDRMTIFVHSNGVQVDVKTSEPKAWGSMLQHYTGSKLHNIHLRTLAKEKDLSLSENGIKKNHTLMTYTNETSFYKALGLQYIPPELREGTGEIEAAQKNTPPHLVELSDLKGDLHIHTNLDFPSSHDMGASSIQELLHKAQELQYDYLGFSDHNPKQSGLSAEERIQAVEKRATVIKQEVEKFRRQSKHTVPQIFLGLEIDILPSGELAIEEKALEFLDYAIVSIHSQFTQPREVMTQRILNGLAHPKVKILGHPTGRQLGMRPEISCDWQKIFTFCAEQHKFIEINSSPQRLDLPDLFVKEAAQHGVKFVINTDAHRVTHMDFMKYGVWVARRGWCQKSQIINTLPLVQVKQCLR